MDPAGKPAGPVGRGGGARRLGGEVFAEVEQRQPVVGVGGQAALETGPLPRRRVRLPVQGHGLLAVQRGGGLAVVGLPGGTFENRLARFRERGGYLCCSLCKKTPFGRICTLRLGASCFSRWSIAVSPIGRIWATMRLSGRFVIVERLGQHLRQPIDIDSVPGLRRHAAALFLEHAQGGELTTRGYLLLWTHARLGLPAVSRALLFFPEPPATLGRGRGLGQEQGLAQEDGALDVDTIKLSEDRLIGHRPSQQRGEHCGRDLHASCPSSCSSSCWCASACRR